MERNRGLEPLPPPFSFSGPGSFDAGTEGEIRKVEPQEVAAMTLEQRIAAAQSCASRGKFSEACELLEHARIQVLSLSHESDMHCRYWTKRALWAYQGLKQEPAIDPSRYEAVLKTCLTALRTWQKPKQVATDLDYRFLQYVRSSCLLALERGKELDQELQAMKQKYKGQAHPAVAMKLLTVGRAYREQGYAEQALKLYFQAVGMAQTLMGDWKGEGKPPLGLMPMIETYIALGEFWQTHNGLRDTARYFQNANRLARLAKLDAQHPLMTYLNRKSGGSAECAQKKGKPCDLPS